MKKWMASLFVATVLLVSSRIGRAGMQDMFGGCSKNDLDGSGSCYGTFLWFRNNPDHTAIVNFLSNGLGSGDFNAQLNGIWYSCVVPPMSALSDQWSMAMANTGGFWIAWNGGGTCTMVYLANSSANSNY